MADVKFYKVTSLPATPAPDSVYFVQPNPTDQYATLYITSNAGSAKPIIKKVVALDSPNDIDVPTTNAVSTAINTAKTEAVDQAVTEAVQQAIEHDQFLYTDDFFETL